jgi:phosphoglycerate dehydrogenase-like enzyme
MAPQALVRLDECGIVYDYFDVEDGEVQATAIAGYDAIVLLDERFGPRALDAGTRLLGIARWGAGYDAIDLDACTGHDVCVFNTPGGVRRPVALSIMTFLLALAHKLHPKDAIVRHGDWRRATEYIGETLTGKSLGSLGLGNIGRELFRLAAPLEMRHIAHDPNVTPAAAEAVGVTLVTKEMLLRESDFLCINCPLTRETQHLIGAAELALMKPSAYLINTARGPIVDQDALIAALQNGRLRGAGLDVFEQEPLPLDSPLLALDNVWLTPHALAWTDELLLNISLEDAENLVRLSQGNPPQTIVNAAVIARAGFQDRLRALRGGP